MTEREFRSAEMLDAYTKVWAHTRAPRTREQKLLEAHEFLAQVAARHPERRVRRLP